MFVDGCQSFDSNYWKSLAVLSKPDSLLEGCQLRSNEKSYHRGTVLSCALVISCNTQGRKSDHMAKIVAFCHYDCMA